MANIYVRSSDGNDADNGSTWALAKAKLAGADAIESAGDSIFLASTHSETTAGAVTFTSAGTTASPTKIMSVSDAAEPPTTLAAGATIGTSGNNAIVFNGFIYSYGLVVAASTSASIALIYFCNSNASQYQVHEAMAMRCVGSSNGSGIYIGRDSAESGARIQWINSTVKFSAAAQGIDITSSRLEWRNGVNGGSNTGIESGGTSPTALFTSIGEMDASTTGRGSIVTLDGVDLSNGAAGMHICARLTGGSQLMLRNCKLPASWTGSLVSSDCEHGSIAMMVNCDNGDTNYKFRHQTKGAVLDQETTLVMTGGATDESTPVSFKVVTTTNCGPGAIWTSPEMHVRNDATGSAITVTVELLHDSATNLTDDEVWVEVTHNGTSGNPLSETVTDRKTDALASAADQASSSVTWTTTGMTNPNKQKCSVSITPEEVGTIIVRLCIAKASKTLYYNPEPILS